MTFFHYRRFLKKGDDFRGFLGYFAAFFCLFLVIPCLIVVLFSPEPLLFLKEAGLSLGNTGRGLMIAAAGAPLAVLAGFIGSRDAQLRRFYPFSKAACRSPRTFIAFETAYLLLYYTAWEFFYRGILFFPLIPAVGLVPALALQTTVSMLHHLGHPPSELFASLAAGIVFGLIAYFTGSFLYTILLHALAGISTDTFIYQRDYRRKSRA
ncbi:MAG: CPBP family intramembrane glutamic endopeptidase [Candidatus Aminicenantales bacterium]